MTLEVRRRPEFDAWLGGLRDLAGRAVIARRIDRVARGLMGDVRAVGDGVSELRIDYGPGYRVYFARRGEVLIVLLCGGDEDSRARDIARAKAIAATLE